LGQSQRAHADFAEAVALEPNDPQIWKERGGIYGELGQPDQAAADFAKALGMTSGAPGEGRARATILAELLRWDAVFSGVAAGRPDDATLWFARLTHCACRGRWKEATTASDRLKALTPNNCRVWFLDGPLRLELGDREGYHHTCREMLAR